MKFSKKKVLLLLAAVAVIAAGIYSYKYYGAEKHDDAIPISGNIEVTAVESSFKLAGWVEARLVKEGEVIRAGALVAHLDKKELEHEAAIRRAEVASVNARLTELEAGSRPEEIARARAAVAQAQAGLDELLAGTRTQEIDAVRAAVHRAEAEENRAETDYARQQQLFVQDVVSARERDTALAAYRSGQAILAEASERLALAREGPRPEQIAQARAGLSEAEAWYEQVMEGPREETIVQVRADVMRAEEGLRLAETRLSYTTITAPISGIVLSEHVEGGEYVTPGAPVVTIGNLEQVWLRGYINATDLGRVKWGQSVTVTTDTYPDKKYEGVVSFISSEAEFTPKNVQTDRERVKLVYRVKIDVDNPSLELKPGMPADAVIQLTRSDE